jgi:hypothetical protein
MAPKTIHNMNKRIASIILIAHATFLGVTGLWPLIHIESFMAVLGPKTDVWLVNTVALLLVSVTWILFLCRHYGQYKLAAGIAIPTSLSLAFIDFYYSNAAIISDIYQIDGFIQIAFILLWLVILRAEKEGTFTLSASKPH